jgi:hypothetical protein
MFTLYKNQLVMGGNGMTNTMIVPYNEGLLKVVQVDNSTAVLTSEQVGLNSNVDLFDLVSPRPLE